MREFFWESEAAKQVPKQPYHPQNVLNQIGSQSEQRNWLWEKRSVAMWFFYLQLGYDFLPSFLGLRVIGLIGNPLHAAQIPMVAETDDTIFIQFGDNPAVTYHKELVPPPARVDTIYTHIGFIYPVQSPIGEAVTVIHPDDDHHHLGLWQAFWNLKEKTGAPNPIPTARKRCGWLHD